MVDDSLQVVPPEGSPAELGNKGETTNVEGIDFVGDVSYCTGLYHRLLYAHLFNVRRFCTMSLDC